MNQKHIVVQQPAQPEQLTLLFHGVGDSAAGMAPVGSHFAQAFPQALVVSIDGPFTSSMGNGRQWFSVQGITEQGRQGRIDEVMPEFIATVRHWQQQSGLSAAQTTLVGFSQGTIMSLEGVKAQPQLAGQVVGFSGRFATLPQQPIADVIIHLIHGEQDGVISVEQAKAAANSLTALGCSVTLDLDANTGHGINQPMLARAITHLHHDLAGN
ncbi:esterase [Yersinia enterocolitica]|uniref:esterase n=1 Tax=Yersinia enterocolitica TaxID=630 RepID=UPI0003D83477|nr:esterase [Yersinia enterocolitica]EKN3637474.1 esterase [Yersinia enterocolitica]EKN3688309.1 esterase [Yersinia enterocolitica]EKN3715551.1 esterase [Yersinia enterocolitica]EKN3753434.1 esterase [Yersinia enterocolitica]EKN3795300.1 esterase [Yersinia enterocolitica]